MVCDTEAQKARAAATTADALAANLALLTCLSKSTNDVQCQGKPDPCGVVFFNPPAQAGKDEPSVAVDVSVPAKISAACAAIGAAGVAAGGGVDPEIGVTLGSEIGSYSCGAWFKAAAKHNPTILVFPQFVPTVQLVQDLKRWDKKGKIDDAGVQNAIKAITRATVSVRLGGANVPVGVLPIPKAGGTVGAALDRAQAGAEKKVLTTAKKIVAAVPKPF
jgi:hypothetical protein